MATATLRDLFGLSDHDHLFVKLFVSAIRGDTPASAEYTTEDDAAPLVQAVAHGQRVADLARGQYWIHPALSEVVENALLKLHVDLQVRSGQVH
jgi:hypothetical protein